MTPMTDILRQVSADHLVEEDEVRGRRLFPRVVAARHAFISRADEAGYPVVEIARFIGCAHSTVSGYLASENELGAR